MALKIFGFTLGKKDIVQEQPPEQKAFALPTAALDDGAVTITQNAYYGTYVDLEGAVRNELELITRYREMANHPELEQAIDDIVNEAITHDESGEVVSINMDKLKQPDTIKRKIQEEFETVLSLFNFNNLSDDLFKRWYIDGRIYYQVVVDSAKPKEGIKELRYIDPRKIRKVREVQKEKDPRTNAMIIKSMAEYYIYNDRGTTTQTYTAQVNQGVRIAPDAIINVNSGLMDAKNTFVISYLHKAIKPLNQLRMIEDAVVIYRLSRAPERRVFYIDVGNLPKGKAEQYLRDIMIKYRNKMVYDAQTGEMRDDRKHLSMLEDFWLPRREGGKGTEITTLPAGQNLGQIEDVDYFRKKLLQSLNVPYSRMDQTGGGGFAALGRSTEITRDELKFAKFITRLRNKFSQLFDHALKTQLVLKGVCTKEEWERFKEDVYYDFKKDNNFTELRESELLRERIQTLQLVEPFVGKYYSQTWIRKNILQLTDEEIQKMDKEMEKDGSIEQFQQAQQQQSGMMPQETQDTPPIDNVTESDPNQESQTPQLDAEVNKYSGINNR
jgi:polyhydroxyalkanoate synthesis regulator phasin